MPIPIALDFEYQHLPGHTPKVHCVVYKNIKTGHVGQEFFNHNSTITPCPNELSDPDNLLIAHNLAAEAACFDSLGWPCPRKGFCTMTEFRCSTNGTNRRASLIHACKYAGIDCMESAEKNRYRDLAIRGGPFEYSEKKGLLSYCEQDVMVLAELYSFLDPKIHGWEIRGRFMLEQGKIQNRGIPVDHEGLERWGMDKNMIQGEIASDVNRRYKCMLFEERRFKEKNFKMFVQNKNLEWPRLESGRLDLKGSTFKLMSSRHGELSYLAQALKTLKGASRDGFAVGPDGRHRFGSIAFGSSTGRSLPKNCILQGPSWMRSFIKAPPDKVFVISDYKSQEIMVAAACSNDNAMITDYNSGDFYLSLAKRMGALPQSAQRGDSREVDSCRELYKMLALAIQYGMGVKSLATSLGKSEWYAQNMLKTLKRTYPRFWQWRENVENTVAMNQSLHAVLGWQLHPPFASKSSVEQGKPTRLSALNFPIQATGSEILRAAIIRLADEGYKVCAHQHDSIMTELDLNGWEENLRQFEYIMTEATRPLLCGHTIAVESRVLMPGERYIQDRGRSIWDFVSKKLDIK
jgi:hypothetical protein